MQATRTVNGLADFDVPVRDTSSSDKLVGTDRCVGEANPCEEVVANKVEERRVGDARDD